LAAVVRAAVAEISQVVRAALHPAGTTSINACRKLNQLARRRSATKIFLFKAAISLQLSAISKKRVPHFSRFLREVGAGADII
jgi:hypothetical protein